MMDDVRSSPYTIIYNLNYTGIKQSINTSVCVCVWYIYEEERRKRKNLRTICYPPGVGEEQDGEQKKKMMEQQSGSLVQAPAPLEDL